MTAPELLYGLPGAERMERDPEYVLDAIDPEDGAEVLVEEWTVAPVRQHLPAPTALVEHAIEHAADYGEVDEGWSDAAERAGRDPEVIAQAGKLLDAIAARIDYRMADRHVATLRYRWAPAIELLGHGLGWWELVERSVRR